MKVGQQPATLSAVLTRAAELLEEDAQAEQQSCSIGKRQWACKDCPINAQPRGTCPAKVHSTERRRVAKAVRQHANYLKPNPLGGPAKVFDAIADRIRAGEDYHAVLDDYSLRQAKKR